MGSTGAKRRVPLGFRFPALRSAARIGDRLRFGIEDAIWYRPADAAGFHNEAELAAFGLKRSGNHAIINWVLKNHPGVVCFLNHVQYATHFNPYLSFGQAFLKADDRTLNLPRQSKSKVWRARRWHRQHPRKDLLIHSYEDRPLATLAGDGLASQHDRCLGQSGSITNLLVLRDPFNTLASRMQRRDMLSPEESVALWKEYAREFVGDTARLDHRLPVSYNRWCTDAGYRGELAERLGLGAGDLGLDDVPTVGGGSSFEGTAAHGKGSSMKTAERWRGMEADPRFRAAIRDDEVRELSLRIFGEVPGTESLFA